MGYHHAGMETADRKVIEGMFTTGDLPVLCQLLLNILYHGMFRRPLVDIISFTPVAPMSTARSLDKHSGNGGKWAENDGLQLSPRGLNVEYNHVITKMKQLFVALRFTNTCDSWFPIF